MASYSDPIVVTYSRDTATTDATWAIQAPYGTTQCKLVDINVSVTTTYNAVTTAAKIGVGVAGNVNDLGYVSFGTTEAGAVLGWKTQRGATAGTNPKYQAMELGGADNTIASTEKVPYVTGPILITFTANTGGSPAGAAVADITLAWF